MCVNLNNVRRLITRYCKMKSSSEVEILKKSIPQDLKLSYVNKTPIRLGWYEPLLVKKQTRKRWGKRINEDEQKFPSHGKQKRYREDQMINYSKQATRSRNFANIETFASRSCDFMPKTFCYTSPWKLKFISLGRNDENYFI